MTITRIKVMPSALGQLERRIGERSRTLVTQAIEQSRSQFIRKAQERTLRLRVYDLGRVYRGWYTTHQPFNVMTLKNRAAHSVFVEAGRRAGARMPPPGALLGWVSRHFGVSGAAARGIAFAVARKIARRGIRPRPIATAVVMQREGARLVRDHISTLMLQEMRRRGNR